MAYRTPTMMQRICEYSTSPQLELSRDTSIKGRAEESRPRKGFDCRCCIFLICCTSFQDPIAASPADDKILSEKLTPDTRRTKVLNQRVSDDVGINLESSLASSSARDKCVRQVPAIFKILYLPSSVLTPQDDTSHSPSQRQRTASSCNNEYLRICDINGCGYPTCM